MLSVLKTIDDLKAKLETLSPMNVEDQTRLNKKFRLEFNFNSNHIEGNTLTYGETKLLLFFGDTVGKHSMRELEEMKAHDLALRLIEEWADDKITPLTEVQIKNLNRIILVEPFWKEAITRDGQTTMRLIKVGDYKEFSNNVRLPNGEIFEFASPSDTPILMGELIEWYRKEVDKANLHPVELAALFHYKFVRIHPFDDGNGRTARLLVNYILLNYDFPPIIIKSSDKMNYLRALHLADIGDIEPFVNYIAEQVIWSLQISIKAAKSEEIDEPEDLDKRLSLLKRKLGEKSDEEVKSKYSDTTLKNLMLKTILPLIYAWERKLKSFETMFLNRKVTMSFEKGRIQTQSFDETFESQYLRYIDLFFIKSNNIRTVEISCSFNGLRNINNNLSVNGGGIYLEFYENAYEINWSGNKRKVNKLYYQDLSESEINKIVLDVGNWLYNNIEQILEGNN